MFGYMEENATPHSGRTDRADVNKRGALFGGREVWLPKMVAFEWTLPVRASARDANHRHRTPRSRTDGHRADILSRLSRSSVQVRDAESADVGCHRSTTEFKRTHPDQQVR